MNALAPGATDTPAVDVAISAFAHDEAARQEWKANHAADVPLGRMSRPEEQAAAALFLASTESSYITGAELVVDGGLTQV